MIFVTLKEEATCCALNCLADLPIGEDIFIDADVRRLTARDRKHLQVNFAPALVFFCNSECAEKYWDEVI